jgi:hypothetical protein
MNLRPKSKLSNELYEIRREGKGWGCLKNKGRRVI